MNTGSFHQPVTVLHSGRTCWIQCTQQKTSHVQISSSLTTLVLLLPVWYFRKMFSRCCCASWVQLSFGEMSGRPVRHKMSFQLCRLDTKSHNCRTPGDLGGLEVLEISTSFSPCFQPSNLQLGNKWATWSDIFIACLPTFPSLCYYLRSRTVCAQADSMPAQWGFHHRGWRPCTCIWMFGARSAHH